jgi:hypothetical protein
MPRKAALLVTATAITVAAGVVGASPASAAKTGPNAHSQHGQCTSATAGLHKGWEKHNAERNVGGNCPAQ